MAGTCDRAMAGPSARVIKAHASPDVTVAGNRGRHENCPPGPTVSRSVLLMQAFVAQQGPWKRKSAHLGR